MYKSPQFDRNTVWYTNTTQTNAFNKSIESSILLLHSIEFHQQPPIQMQTGHNKL